jgi:hypothetical protein
MPIVVREELEIDGAKPEFVRVYKPDNHRLTVNEKKRADLLDQSIEKEIKNIKEEIKKLGLLKSSETGKNDIEFWYEIGSRLNVFLANNPIPNSEQSFFFDSVTWYAEEYDLFVGTKERRNNFDYASRIAKWDKTFAVKVSWGIWTHIYDSTLTKADERIGTWIIEKLKHIDNNRRDWFRGYFKVLNATLKNFDTTENNQQEIEEELEKIQKKYDATQSNQTKKLIEEETS